MSPCFNNSMKKLLFRMIALLMMIFTLGFVFPEQLQIPVQGATVKDWNPKSFWYHPWGRSGVHRGIDIFAKEGTPVLASTGGFVIFSGKISMGGNVVLMLGPKWRLHYFAHLKDSNNRGIGFVDAGKKLGEVGTSGNAAGKSPHLHYSIRSLYPRFWLYPQLEKAKVMYAKSRMYYIDPNTLLKPSKG